ncbi:bifunctional diaminohydroxyphosphoribosylaminopyrimidine deaminase/5-amino-6-(5-phosphoribosylamino)uracil reductase RibD [Alteromonas facilis]|uniref:bifunctional diaminohydroxyphosphoribosylaminopyrimidine deaminase/5-amino-6-(5-phosphoribosylamino)uracil reductase RibD n=1 Tax=Alteromonas facilis TaxID=2048004 RepID=UPI000C29571C
MNRAIALAKQGVFTTTPNPNVGCVIVDDTGLIIGEGFHQQAGTPHAEVHALAQAGVAAKGATAYVTLEPCSHHGRTGPCAEALVNAGVARVVVAMQDPNPLVAGQGIAKLKAAGIGVSVGVAESEAQALNRGFVKRMTAGKPFVTLKLASSLDGRTALSNGESQWITGPAARQDVHKLRAQQCAVLTGADTVLVDNPQLTARVDKQTLYPSALRSLPLRQPVRVIIDSQNRLHADLQVFHQTGQSIVVNLHHNDALSDFSSEQVVQWQVKEADGRVDLNDLMLRLSQAQFNHVWLECGATLAGAMFARSLVDEIVLYQAPKLMGQDARSLLTLPHYSAMTDIPELSVESVETLENDIKLVLSPRYQL